MPARAADTSSSQSSAPVRAVLEQVDEALHKGNDEATLSLVLGVQGEDGGLRGVVVPSQICVASSWAGFLILSMRSSILHPLD